MCIARFEGRHHGLTETFLRHADELSDRLDPELPTVSDPPAAAWRDLHQ